MQPSNSYSMGIRALIFCGLVFVVSAIASAGEALPIGDAARAAGHFAGIPSEKPADRPLSAAIARLYDQWGPLGDFDNEFYTNFKYSRLSGIGKDPQVSRRDPSKVIRVDGKYYVWYTRRKTVHRPVGLSNYTDDTPDDVPAWDWDLADIYYATSKDGFHWTEQGVAVDRNKKGEYADRSISTADILCVNGKYYLYYQAFTGRFSQKKGDRADVTMAWADSPDGPWHKVNRPIIQLGQRTEWDGGSIHDPYPLIYKGQIWLYYKSDVWLHSVHKNSVDKNSVEKNGADVNAVEHPPGASHGPRPYFRMHGVAIADRPEGPFVKSPLNPVANSGHETSLFPYKEGIVSLIIKDGPEKNTVQYAADGLNFEVKSTVVQPPVAAGPFCPDAFTGNGDGRGICWGVSHMVGYGNGFLLRFDCDLHRDVDRSFLSWGTIQADEASHFQPRTTLPQGLRDRFAEEAISTRDDTANIHLTPQADDQIEAAVRTAKEVAAQGPFKPTWKSLENYEIPPWYQDAKFGIFIHWGVYCVPAYMSEWYPRMMYIDQDTWRGNAFRHHRETYGPHLKFGYKDFIPQLTADKFDAAQWATLFKDAGARYVVPVAEHHDGFPMYDCSFTRWSAAKMGPRRDIVGELAKAVRAKGMRFGVSSHRAFNWAFFGRRADFDTVDPQTFGLYGRDIEYLYGEGFADYKKNNWPPHDGQFKDDWLARTCELVDKYQPDLVWFDFGIAPSWIESYDTNPFADHLKLFTAYYYNHADRRDGSAVINYKFNAFPEKAAVLDLERSKMDSIRHPFWQTDTAVSTNSWGYIKTHKYKPVNRLVDDLIDIVSKNGCLLLNIGPRPDGTIPGLEQDMLREIGRWLAVNGEAIYGTRPWRTFGEGPTGTATGHLSEKKNQAFTAEDVRFTTKEDSLYAILLDWPEGQTATIKSLGSEAARPAAKIKEVRLLGCDDPIQWAQNADGLTIRLPDKKPCDHAFVFKIVP